MPEKRKRRPQFNQEMEKVVIKSVSGGKPLKEICKELGITTHAELVYRRAHDNYKLQYDNALQKRIELEEKLGVGKVRKHLITPKVEEMIIASLMEGQTLVYICNQLNITRMTEWNHRQANPVYSRRLEDAMERRIESVEESLYSKAVGGDVNAQKFFLTNLSHGRWKNIQDHRIGGEEEGKPIRLKVNEVFIEIPVETEEEPQDEEKSQGE